MLFAITLTACPGQLFGYYQQLDSNQAAIAFEKEQYSVALKAFTGLLKQYPRDPMYHYYAGVCRVQLEKEPEKALDNLYQAQSGGMFKSVPEDVLFYQGRAAQMAGDFKLAEKSYKAFKNQARRKVYKEYDTDRFLEQVRQGQKGMEKAAEKPAEKPEVMPPDSSGQTVKTVALHDVVSGKKEVDESPERQEPEDGLHTPQTPADTGLLKLEEAYESALHTALDWQFRADSVRRIADQKRRQLQTASGEEKNNLRQEILALEKQVFQHQRVADQKYSGVRKMELKLYEQQEKAEEKSREENLSLQQEEEIPVAKPKESPDTAGRQHDMTPPSRMVLKKIPQINEKPVFQMFRDRGQEQATLKGPVETIPPLREGLVYRIQIAVFRNPVQQSYFKGLGPVVADKDPEKDLTWYYIGMFRTLQNAREALKKVQQRGFEDAFVVAFFNGNRQSFSRAEILEQEWAGKPLKTFRDTSWIEKKVPVTEAKTDTVGQAYKEPVELTLSFRVKVKVSKEPLEEKELSEIKRLAVQKGWESYRTEDGNYAYVIGKFLTFENASEYADLLYRNGLRDATVVAFLGTKEIPVELARKLTEQYDRS